jgi:hypothetical protein
MAAIAGPLHAATIDNSDFEGDTVGTAPTGWTVVDQKIDLGVSEIAGCRVVDTSTYGNLRNFSDYALMDYDDDDVQHPNLSDFEQAYFDGDAPQSTVSGQLLWEYEPDDEPWIGPATATDISEMTKWSDAPQAVKDAHWAEFGLVPTDRRDDDADTAFDETDETPNGRVVSVVDGSAIEDFVDEEGDGATYSYTRPGQVLEFRTDITNNSSEKDGYVMHGPAIYSEEFESGPGRQLSLWWAASGAIDDFHVFGYLLNVDTCEQTEVLDANGLASAWQRTRASVTENGTYRFVFVTGTYDQTWGGAGGSLLWIDDISEEVDEDPPAPTGPTLTNTGTDATVALWGAALVVLGLGAVRLRRRHS